MSITANWSYPTSIRFGAGRIAELGEACHAAGISNPLIVTDPGIAPLPITATALDVLENAGLGRALFSNVQPNPTAANVESGLSIMRQGGHDGVVAFGGGSALDAGKVIAFMKGQPRPMWDFEDIGDWWTRADPDGIAPIVAVPTTSGTGSEVGRAGVITNEETHTKKIIFHPKMLPLQVICDAELTTGLPPHITAGTGLDAFIHSLEAYSAPSYHPMSEGIAVEGMRLVKEFLPRAYHDGNDIEARGHMLSAAAMGATAFQKGLGGIHALSHSAGAVYNTPHGLTNAVFMPYVLEFNRKAIEHKINRLADWLSIKGGFAGFMDYVLKIREELGIPHKIGDIGIDDKQFDLLAKMAVVDPSAGGNPVKLEIADSMMLLENAWSGKMG
jgi:alcohol dehydrogenase class IV